MDRPTLKIVLSVAGIIGGLALAVTALATAHVVGLTILAGVLIAFGFLGTLL